LLDGRVLLDAGTVTAALSLEEQLAIDHVLLTHAHLDHMVDLAFLADNVFTRRTSPLRIWAPAPVLAALHAHLFNDSVWPDFTRLPAAAPGVELCPLAAGSTACVGGVQVRWERTAHPVFAAGYCLTDGAAGLLYSGDTGVTEALWQLARACPQLQVAFIDT
jgi:ribonuclease BN (tRNA processing enzyme)